MGTSRALAFVQLLSSTTWWPAEPAAMDTCSLGAAFPGHVCLCLLYLLRPSWSSKPTLRRCTREPQALLQPVV